MTMLGRGKRSAPEKKNAKDKATKAEEAAEAARLAEEAAAKAREAARLAQVAADEAAAEAEEPEDVEPEDVEPEAEAPEDAEEAPKAPVSLLKPQDRQDDSEDAVDRDNASEEESEPPEAASETRKGSTRRRYHSGSLTTVIAVLVVLAIAFGTGTTVLALKVREQNATETASKEASFAASRAAQKLSSYDFQTLDADLKAASATTTGKLRSDYDKLAQQLKTVAVQQQAVSTTTVMKVGVVSATPDKVVALVYANRSSATKADKQKRLPEPLRIKMTMVKQDGKWLASELTVIS